MPVIRSIQFCDQAGCNGDCFYLQLNKTEGVEGCTLKLFCSTCGMEQNTYITGEWKETN